MRFNLSADGVLMPTMTMKDIRKIHENSMKRLAELKEEMQSHNEVMQKEFAECRDMVKDIDNIIHSIHDIDNLIKPTLAEYNQVTEENNINLSPKIYDYIFSLEKKIEEMFKFIESILKEIKVSGKDNIENISREEEAEGPRKLGFF